MSFSADGDDGACVELVAANQSFSSFQELSLAERLGVESLLDGGSTTRPTAASAQVTATQGAVARGAAASPAATSRATATSATTATTTPAAGGDGAAATLLPTPTWGECSNDAQVSRDSTNGAHAVPRDAVEETRLAGCVTHVFSATCLSDVSSFFHVVAEGFDDASVALPPGSYEIVLVVDIRENTGARHDKGAIQVQLHGGHIGRKR